MGGYNTQSKVPPSLMRHGEKAHEQGQNDSKESNISKVEGETTSVSTLDLPKTTRP